MAQAHNGYIIQHIVKEEKLTHSYSTGWSMMYDGTF